MKTILVLLCVLVTQMNSAYIGEFEGSSHSVDKSFGKLMNDVLGARQTIDCTVEAMKEDVDSGNLLNVRNQKCGNQNGKLPVNRGRKSRSTNQAMLRKLRKQQTQKINDIENLLMNESQRLSNVDNLLKNELEGISKDVNDKLEKISQTEAKNVMVLQNTISDTAKTSDEEPKVLTNINIELSNADNSSDIKINNLLTKFQTESNKTLIGIEKRFKDWEQGESEQLQEIKRILENTKYSVNYDDPTKTISNDLSEDASLTSAVTSIPSTLSTSNNINSETNIRNLTSLVTPTASLNVESITRIAALPSSPVNNVKRENYTNSFETTTSSVEPTSTSTVTLISSRENNLPSTVTPTSSSIELTTTITSSSAGPIASNTPPTSSPMPGIMKIENNLTSIETTTSLSVKPTAISTELLISSPVIENDLTENESKITALSVETIKTSDAPLLSSLNEIIKSENDLTSTEIAITSTRVDPITVLTSPVSDIRSEPSSIKFRETSTATLMPSSISENYLPAIEATITSLSVEPITTAETTITSSPMRKNDLPAIETAITSLSIEPTTTIETTLMSSSVSKTDLAAIETKITSLSVEPITTTETILTSSSISENDLDGNETVIASSSVKPITTTETILTSSSISGNDLAAIQTEITSSSVEPITTTETILTSSISENDLAATETDITSSSVEPISTTKTILTSSSISENDLAAIEIEITSSSVEPITTTETILSSSSISEINLAAIDTEITSSSVVPIALSSTSMSDIESEENLTLIETITPSVEQTSSTTLQSPTFEATEPTTTEISSTNLIHNEEVNREAMTATQPALAEGERLITTIDDSFNDYGGFFDSFSNIKNVADNDVSSAEKLIQQGIFAKSLLNSISGKIQDAPRPPSAVDHPELFNFV